MTKKNVPAKQPDYSKTTNRLVDLIKHVVDLTAGPKRLVAKARAEAEAKIISETGAAEALRIRTIARMGNQELRRQENMESVALIAQEEAKALPYLRQTSEKVFDPDFVDRFFEECQDISNAEMQQLWGRLLAGEVAEPGTFHPLTLRVLKYMTVSDARLFSNLCHFSVIVMEEPCALVFNVNEPIYNDACITFSSLTHLQSLGLITFNNITGYRFEKAPRSSPLCTPE